MEEGFRNKQDWFTLAAAMVVWAAHFTFLWVASSVFPDQPAARWLAVLFTIVAAGALVWLWRRAEPRSLWSVAGLGIAIAATGVAFDVMPALIG